MTKKYLIASLTIIPVAAVFFILNPISGISGKLHQRNTKTITGIVTNKFTDCEGGSQMDKNGNITPIEEITCDGGSTITIDYKETFITITGNVPNASKYAVDVTEVQVGDKAIVRYAIDKDGHKTLGCKDCSVEKSH